MNGYNFRNHICLSIRFDTLIPIKRKSIGIIEKLNILYKSSSHRCAYKRLGYCCLDFDFTGGRFRRLLCSPLSLKSTPASVNRKKAGKIFGCSDTKCLKDKRPFLRGTAFWEKHNLSIRLATKSLCLNVHSYDAMLLCNVLMQTL